MKYRCSPQRAPRGPARGTARARTRSRRHKRSCPHAMRWAAGGLRPKDWALLFGLKAALITTVVLVDRRYPWILTAERETEPPRSYTTEQSGHSQ